MSIGALVRVNIGYLPDGANQMSVLGAQSIAFNLAMSVMPGGNTVSAGNLNTLGTNIGTAIQTTLQTYLSQISGWTTGGQ